jgi:undecaprenyl diphosphate synthase
MIQTSQHAALPSTSGAVPAHIAIIMDGNGRWAKKRHLPKIAGHRKGAEALRALLKPCHDMGVKHLTVYAFSSENWGRPADEVSDLMQLLKTYLSHEVPTLIENKVRLRIIGDKSKLSDDICSAISKAEAATALGEKLELIICLSYGARQELTCAMRALAKQVQAGTLLPEAITDELIQTHLHTNALPDPDLLIRTGGEQRLSNFLLWQSAYAELYFTDVLWPDFTPQHLREAILDFAGRERRFGTTS